MSTNKLALTKSLLEEPEKLSGIFELVPFKESFITNYENVTGLKNGAMFWEREKIAFLQKLASDPKVSKCTRMSVYGAFTQLATSGLSLVDDNAYLIPYKEVLQFQIGWKGRLEQMSRMDGIVSMNEPMVVYSSDDFDYTLAPDPAILKHKRKRERPDDDKITHVYISYKSSHGPKCFIMEAHEIYKIRDQFSESYKYYKSKGGEWKPGQPMDLPFALGFPEKYFKKTCVKTLYNSLPKSPAMKELDSAIKMNADVEEIRPVQDVTHEVETPKSDENVEYQEPEIVISPEKVEAQTDTSKKPFDKSESGQEL